MHLIPIISCHLSSVDTDAPPTTQHRQRSSVKGLIEFIFRACTGKNYPSIIKHMLIHARRTMIATKPMTVTRIGTSSHTIFVGGEQLQAVKVNWHSCRCSQAFDGELDRKKEGNNNRKGGGNREGVKWAYIVIFSGAVFTDSWASLIRTWHFFSTCKSSRSLSAKGLACSCGSFYL